MLSLSRENWARICEHAGRDYPSECCGILLRAADGACEVRPCENIQDRLHREHPEDYPRDSRTAYQMGDPLILDRASRAGQLMGIYHSHIDCDAYFSDKDRADALPWGEPAYPGAIYLVLSVHGREVRGRMAFAWEEGRRVFEEAPVVIG